jgi:hypothetical protein
MSKHNADIHVSISMDDFIELGYDQNDINPKNNIDEHNIDGQKGGYHAEQSGTIAQPTLRQLTQNNTYQQPSGFNNGQKGGYHAEQSGTIAQPTLRQMSQNNTYQQPSGFNDGQKGGYHAEQFLKPVIDEKYFNCQQFHKHDTNTPDDGINVYSFAISPGQYQPNGTVNMTKWH